MDVQFRKFIRRIAPGMNWSPQWPDILKAYSTEHWAHASGIACWSKKCVVRYWNCGFYITNSRGECSVRRALGGNPCNISFLWATTTKLGHKDFGNWEIVARKAVRWMLCFRLSYISVPCKCCWHVFRETPASFTIIGMCIHIFFSTSALTLGSPTGVGADLTWLDLAQPCLRHHWNVAPYFATLPGHHWIKGILIWQQ